MKINKLTLNNFRNFSYAELNCASGLNIITGNNGQGKTNLLEAMVFLSSGRSFRSSQDHYMIKHDNDFTKIKAEFNDQDKKIDLEAVISAEGKYCRVNQNVIKRLSDFIGICNIVLFEPNDLNFFSSPPKDRRKDIDFEISKISDHYFRDLSLFLSILTERNAYLKESYLDDDYLEVLTDRLIEISLPIYKERLAFTQSIELKVEKLYRNLSKTDRIISLEYKSWIQDESFDNLKQKMMESLKRDKDFKITHSGIHRDDFIFKMDGIPVVNIASQGQKRLLMIAMKWALIELIYEKMGSYPILCLDDLFSELDSEKRCLILQMIDEKMQVFITTTDLNFIETKRPYKHFDVSMGQAKELGK